jgi:hypothetical protein
VRLFAYRVVNSGPGLFGLLPNQFGTRWRWADGGFSEMPVEGLRSVDASTVVQFRCSPVMRERVNGKGKG